MKNYVKVLYVLADSMKRGGTEAFIMNYFRHFDHSKIQIDFVEYSHSKGIYDDELMNCGSHIYYISLKGEHPIKFDRELRKIFLSGEYKIVHSMLDTMNTWVLKVAKECGIPVRIAHSHNTKIQSKNVLKLLFNNYTKKKLGRYANYRMACGNEAGKWLFGNDSFQIVPNALSYDKFRYNEMMRRDYRHRYQFESYLVVGHVGQFREQKNHMFLVDIFYELHKMEPNSHLVLVGTGRLQEKVNERAEAMGLADCVTIIAGSDRINELLNMFDCFVFPSLFEGLSVALLEAQVNGLSCYASNTIARESNILNKVEFMDFSAGAKQWAEKILSDRNNFSDRTVSKKQLIDTGYEIESAAERLESFYLSFCD